MEKNYKIINLRLNSMFTDLPCLPIKRKMFRFHGGFFKSSAFLIYFEIPNFTGHSIEVLIFSTSFVISVLFADVKREKIGSFCVTGRSNIAIFLEHKNLLSFLP